MSGVGLNRLKNDQLLNLFQVVHGETYGSGKPRAVYYEKENVGHTLTQSKVRYTWVFEIEYSMHRIVLLHSKISGKIKVYHNDKMVLSREMPPSKFPNISFDVEQFYITLEKNFCENTYSLLIDGRPFSKLQNEQHHTPPPISAQPQQTTKRYSLDSAPNTPSFQKSLSILGHRLGRRASSGMEHKTPTRCKDTKIHSAPNQIKSKQKRSDDLRQYDSINDFVESATSDNLYCFSRSPSSKKSTL